MYELKPRSKETRINVYCTRICIYILVDRFACTKLYIDKDGDMDIVTGVYFKVFWGKETPG